MTSAFSHPAAEPVSFPAPSFPTFCFAISARPEPAVMPRVLEPFAKRGLVPSRWHAVCGAPDELVIDLQVQLDPALVELVAASLRQIVGVESVLTSEKRYALSA